MKALLFPGQGSQSVGMCRDFYDKFERVKKLFQNADDILNIKLSNLILKGPQDQLKLTENTQPAILLVSYSIFTIMKEEYGFDLGSCKYFAGHSLGEYSALVCSGSLKFDDALKLVKLRGKAMQESVPVGKGAMLAILGSEISEIEKNIEEIKKDNNLICEIANDNADGQVIVSGEIEIIDKLKNFLKIKKIKSILLPVSAPFHSSMMKEAEKIMFEKIMNTNFSDPQIEIISNVDANPNKDKDIIKKLLVDQICSRVRWRESILNMKKSGINEYIEIGPGKVLSGMIKRITKNVDSKNINTIEDVENL